MTLPPPLTALSDLDNQLAGSGYAVLDADSLARLAGINLPAMAAWQPLWDDLPPDQHLKDGGRYRRRRHGCFLLAPSQAPSQAPRLVPHRAHWQPVEYNALHGGIERWFEPLPPRPGGRRGLVGPAAGAGRRGGAGCGVRHGG